MAERMTEREIYELVRRIFVAGARRATQDDARDAHAVAVSFIASLDQKLAELNDGEAGA